ncbi:hypothetical protein ES703_113155 [subsurface metagenome]
MFAQLVELSSLRSQLECWNNGKLEYWVLGNCGSGLLENAINKEVNKMRNFHIRSLFQHSSIPLFQVRGNTQQPQKTPLILICCRNSETLN